MTLAEKAYDSLRRDIVTGQLKPGAPLRMAQLSQRYEMGFSPLREALNRLQAERLVTSVALKGFSVAPLSMEEMWDATNTRILIEQRALRLSIEQGGDEWEAGIVGSLHALLLQAARGSATEAEARALEARYRHPMLAPAPGEPARDVQAEHEALARAALARDADLAVALLAEHYRRTAQRVERLTLSAEDAILGQTAQARIDLATLAP
jgi:DNA-binding GntR family transcriptional regulator